MSDNDRVNQIVSGDEPIAKSGATHVEMGEEKLISFVGPNNTESTYARNSPEMIFGVLSKPIER